MTDTFFEIIRPGINTTIQDRGRKYTKETCIGC